MNKLKIAIIGHLKYALAEPFVGGLESFTHNIAKSLISRGHEVVVFAAEGTDEQINPHIICDPTELYKEATTTRRDLKKQNLKIYNTEHNAYLKIMDILRNSDFDIVHNNSLHYGPITSSNMLPMPMVTTLHTPPLDFIEDSLKASDNKNNTIVTISKYMEKIWSPIIKSQVIYNGINLENFIPLNNDKKENYAIWFGRITSEKGTKYAVKAAKKAGIPLKIAGTIYCEKYFSKKIKPLLNKNIEYIGVLDHTELRKTIAKAKVSLCTPNWEEPYGLVVAEALACGTPVVSFERGAIPEILDSKSGILVKLQKKELFGRIKAVKNLSNALLKAINLNSDDCRKRAEEIADINIMIDKYEKLYYYLIMARKNLNNTTG